MKNAKHFLLTVAMLLCSFAVSAQYFEIERVRYNVISDSEVGVTSNYGTEYNGAIVIPYSVTYNSKNYSVTSIKSIAFSDCKNLVSITIPASVTSIEDYAFNGCSGLKEVILEDGCETLSLGNSSYDQGLFYDCPLEKVYMGRDLDYGSWEYSPFKNKAGLNSLIIGETVTTIGDCCFWGCSSLTSITIPDGVTTIENNAFRDCSSLASFTGGKGLTQWGEWVLYGCNNLTEITIDCANCSFSSSWGTSSIRKIILGENVENISLAFFADLDNLTSIEVSENNPIYDSRQDCNAIIKTSTNRLVAGCSTTIIPESVEAIGASAFESCSGLTSINIPPTITNIEDGTFKNCTGLASITIPEGVTSIGESAFSGCSSLTSITIPESVTSIGESAFSGCSGLTSITIPEGVTSIGVSVFSGCSSLTSITIPESVTSIGESAFSGCSGLTSITIPEGVTSIGYDAFYDCRNLKKVINYSDLDIQKGSWDNGYVAYYADRVINLDEVVDGYAFKTKDGVYNLIGYIGDDTELTLPTDYQGENYQIGEDAFYGCISITSITIPNSVTSIGDRAFYDCRNLKKVINYSDLDIQKGWDNGYVAYYADRVINLDEVIDGYAFKTKDGVHNLIDYMGDDTELTLPADYQGENYQIGDDAFYGCINITSITIPNSVTSIGDRAFENCSGITSITIPNSITEIGHETFIGCDELFQVTFDCANIGSWFSGKSSIKEVILGENVKAIGDAAFSTCSSLTSITIPENSQLTSIGDRAFENCSGITSITIPNSITEIGHETFIGCDELFQVTFDCANIGSWFSGKSSIKEVILGESVKAIGDYAFSGCSGITSINIPEGVTSMGYGAFNGCESLAEVHINSIEAWCEISFGGNPLSYAHNLYLNGDLVTELIIPEGVTSIRSQAFSGCTNITSVSIPESVTSIENEAFNGCENLAEVHINSLEAWCNIDFGSTPLSYAKNLYLNGELVTDLVIPSTITSIKSYAFKNCQNLTSVVIPEGVTSIGSSTFEGCSGITSINIPEGVTSIGGSALSSCSSLTSITIPGSVTSIDWAVFSGCNSLTSVTIHEGVTELDYYTFNECNSLISITLPESITSLNGQVFEDCSNLTAVTILGSLTQVDGEPFRGCNNLKEMIFGEKVRKIEAGAFAEVESLEKITVYATQPPRTDGDIFSDEVYDNATLYVPQGCISKYQVMTGWSGFYNISEIEGSTPNYLTIRQADNGAVKIAVDLGRTYKVQIEPTEGWAIHSVTFDGKDMTAQLDESYTFTTPTLTGSAVLNVAYEQVRVNKVVSVRSDAIKVRGYQDKLFISGTESGDHIAIYTVGGIAVAEVKTEGINTEISVESGQLYIVKVAGKVVKIQM